MPHLPLEPMTPSQQPRLGRRRARTASMTAVVLSALLALPSTVDAAPSSARQLEHLAIKGASAPLTPAEKPAETPAETPTETPMPEPQPVDDIEQLRIACASAVTETEAGVRCRWSVPDSDDVAGVRLLRIVVGSDAPRTTVFRTTDPNSNTHADTPIRPETTYAYAVQGLNTAGRVIATSRTITVDVPALTPPIVRPEVEVVRLRCTAGGVSSAPGTLGRTVVGCEWSPPVESPTRVVTLWRSVDGGVRERVVSFDAPFTSSETSYRDVVPAGTSRVVYAVIGTDGDGDVVARSRPEAVGIRSAEVVRVDPVPGAVQPVDRPPASTLPVDTVPVDTLPVDTLPVDTVDVTVPVRTTEVVEVVPTETSPLRVATQRASDPQRRGVED